jgi:flagellar biosynthetic protein FliP
MAGEEMPATEEELEQSVNLPITVVTPAFVTSELKAAFWIGFLVYIPFMLIDVIVSSTLMSMGMIMLPPSMISTPFKILLFILLDGWQLLFSTLIQTVK